MSEYDSSKINRGNLYHINPNKQYIAADRHIRSQNKPTIEEIRNSLQVASMNDEEVKIENISNQVSLLFSLFFLKFFLSWMNEIERAICDSQYFKV